MLQIKNRLSFFYVERGGLTVIDGCLVLTDNEAKTQYEVPARAMVSILVGPGTAVSTDAMRLAGRYGVSIIWVGEHGVRCYSAGRAWSGTRNGSRSRCARMRTRSSRWRSPRR